MTIEDLYLSPEAVPEGEKSQGWAWKPELDALYKEYAVKLTLEMSQETPLLEYFKKNGKWSGTI